MSFIEFPSVFVEKDAPDTITMCRIESIELVQINTAGNDKENTGDYYVWLYLKSGQTEPCFAGTLEECKEAYRKLQRTCDFSLGDYSLCPLFPEDEE